MVANKIIRLLGEITGIDEYDISEMTEFTRDFGIEPIDLASLIILAEKEFHITIHDEYVLGFKTINDLALYIEEELDSY